MKAIGAYLFNHPRWALIVLLVMTAYSIFRLPDLRMELDFANYFPSDSKDLEFYEAFTDRFGNRDDHVLIGIFREEGVFDPQFLRHVDSLTRLISETDLVEHCQSITTLELPRRTVLGPLSTPVIDQNDWSNLKSDSVRIQQHPLIMDQLVSSDFRSTVLFAELTPERTFDQDSRIVHKLDSLLEQFDFEQAHILSRVDLEVRYSERSAAELMRLSALCIGLIVILMSFIYRSYLAVILSLAVFVLSAINLCGILVTLGFKLDVMATMIPSIILIVSVSDTVHIFGRYLSESATREDRVFHIQEVIKANFVTSATTAIGFFTLWLSPVPLLAYFGLYVGLGVLSAFVVSVLLVPPVLILLCAKEIQPVPGFNRRWSALSTWLNDLRSTPRPILLVVLAAMIISALGITLIDMNRTLTSPLPLKGKIAASFDFFAEQFNGGREFELAIETNSPGDLAEIRTLREMERLHEYLDSLPEIGTLASPVSYYSFVHAYNRSGNVSYFRIPETQQALDRFEQRVPPQIQLTFGQVIDSSRQYGAFRGKMPDLGNLASNVLLQDISTWIHKNLDTSLFAFQHTGSPVILDIVNDLQIRAMFKGLLIAILAIGIIMAMLFRNVRMILIVVVINVLPLIVVAGSMGFFGIELRGGTSIVFTIAFVIAVDDSIHLLNNIAARKQAGIANDQAITQTVHHTGLPITITSVVIFCAFLILISSSLGNVRYLGFLVSLTAVMAWMSDLALAPMLMSKFQAK